MKKIIIISSIILIVDQLIKLLISNFTLYHGITVIKDFFTIIYVRNTGAAFSILEGNRLLLIAISLFALFMFYFILRKQKLSKFDIISYGFLIGGILGNLFDRIVRGYVVDYLDFKIFNHYFPVFNLADSFIVIGIILIMIKIIRGDKNANDSEKW